MNRDDVIRMARESGHGVQLDDGGRWGWMWNTNLKMMTDFANLVAAAEREACAPRAETSGFEMKDDLIAAAQRALEVLEELQGGCTDSDDGTVEAITVWCPEIITALRAALEAPALGHIGRRPPSEGLKNDGR